MSDKEVKNQNKTEKPSDYETVSLCDASEAIGGKIGHFQLLSILGEGGAGIVYLAEQKHPIKRQVAIKIIKPGMDTRHVIARFEAERQALALLDHPNIAHVITAGSTEAGRPYFVMEYIKGLPITDYCDHHQLSIKERLKLFIPVCEAVQYAHQKGIIHRDIKPSNIVVSTQNGKPVPKIIDFGVAKAITMPLTDKTMFTRQDQLVGTPEYMSPEQADLKEHDIDTRSDIYSLGVVLYELLAGTLPFESKTLREGGYTEIQRIILQQEPPRPSTKLSSLGKNASEVALSRHIEPSALVRMLHGELEWIPLMAMRKDRDQRYKAASDLSKDLQNYLDGKPLTAGPESKRYKLKKFIKRNKILVTSGSIVAFILISGIIITSTLSIALSSAQAETQQNLNEMITFLEEDILNSFLPEHENIHSYGYRYSLDEEEQKQLLKVLDFATENLKHRFEGNPLAEIRIHRILGNWYKHLSLYDEADEHYKRSLNLCMEHYGPKHDQTLTAMNSLAGNYIDQQRFAEAEELLKDILNTVRKSQKSDSVGVMARLAKVYTIQDRSAEAEALQIEILDICREISEADPLNTLAWTWATSPEATRRDGAKAIKYATYACEITNWENVNYVDTLAAAYAENGDFDAAAKWQEKAIELLSEEDPDNLRNGYEERLTLYQSNKPYRKQNLF